MIYFDNAATTFPKPDCVYEAINEGMKKYSFNAGRGGYKFASDTHKMIMNTREKIAEFAGAEADSVVFTSSATESINNIIYGLDFKENDNVYVSPFEHNAIMRTLKNISVKVHVIPFNKTTWEVDYLKLQDMFIINKPKAVIISHISNVTGFMLPYGEIFNLAKKYNAITVLDSAQGFGVYSVDKKNVDFLIFAGHKSLYAMFGIAGYINYNKIKISLYKVGGTGSDSLNLNMPEVFPYRYEAGSLNSVGIYSINKSLDFLKNNNFASKKHALVSYFLEKIKDLSNIIIYLPKNYVSYGIISFNIEGYNADDVGIILSEDFDICVRTGYHCAPLVHDFIESNKFNGTVRVSFSGFNTYEEIDSLVEALEGI